MHLAFNLCQLLFSRTPEGASTPDMTALNYIAYGQRAERIVSTNTLARIIQRGEESQIYDVCRKYLIILGSIPAGVGTMDGVVALCPFYQLNKSSNTRRTMNRLGTIGLLNLRKVYCNTTPLQLLCCPFS